MKIKGIFTSISGSLGGVVGSHNKGGQYLRARTIPVNPNSASQQRARTDFGDAVADYGNLTAAQRIEWDDFAQQQAWTNSLGDAIQLSGQQHYVAMNSIRKLLGESEIVTPPTPNTRPGTPQVEAVADVTTSPTELSVTWENETGVGADNLLVYVGNRVGPGVNFYRSPYRYIGTVDGEAGAAEILTVPFTFAAGDRIPLKFRTALASGQYSPFAETIIEAVETV